MRIDAYCTIGLDREYDLTPEKLISSLDRAQFRRAVIAPVDRYIAVDNRIGNDFIFQTCSAHREFIPAFAVNPWYGNKALAELSRCAALGGRLLVLNPFLQGFLANDEIVWPLIEAAGEKQLPVYIHTGPGNATPWQIVDLAEKFKHIHFIMGHCGATDFWYDVPESLRAADNIYIESSLARPFDFASYVAAIGSDRAIFGSSAPLSDIEFEFQQLVKLLPEQDFSPVYGANLKKLLEKSGPL